VQASEKGTSRVMDGVAFYERSKTVSRDFERRIELFKRNSTESGEKLITVMDAGKNEVIEAVTWNDGETDNWVQNFANIK
jgi:hypothetical protein